MANINYKNTINKILSTTFNIACRKNGIELINKLMESMNSRFVNYYAENTQDVTTARNAVDEMFTGNLKRLALAEGNRILTLYSNDLIEYKPHYPVKAKKKTKKQLVVAALEFSDGISDLTSLTFSEASLQEQAKKIFCELLEEIAVKIASYTQSRKKDNITVQDIRNALGHLFPPELLKHALAEGSRIAMLFETGMLEERKQAAVKAKRKRTPEKAAKAQPTKRKRKRSLSVESPQRSSRRKIPRKEKTRKKSTHRSVSRKRTPPRKVARKVARKKSTRRKTVPKEDDSRKVSRKRRVVRRVPKKRTAKRVPSRKKRVVKSTQRKVSKKKTTKRAPSRKRRVSRTTERKVSKKKTKRAPSRKRHTPSKKRTVVRKRTERVSPKTVRRISGKKFTKKAMVSEKVTSRGIAATTAKEINRGTRKLNESFRQKLPVDSARIATELITSLFDELIIEIGKLKTAVIGPQEVRSAVMKIFPPDLAQLAIAHLSRVLMT